MAILSLIYSLRQKRNRRGKLVRKVTQVIERGVIVMVGLEVFRTDRPEQAHFSPHNAKVFRAILLKDGLLSRSEMLDYLYPESGTENDYYETSLGIAIVRIRKALAPLKLKIITRPTMGWELKIL